VRQLFIRPTESQLKEHRVDFTVICVPGLHGDPEREGINSEAFVVLNLAKKLVLIGGTYYAGEMKKSIFSLMNYFTTKQNVLPMHCAANIGDGGDTALFFGLSGTGKTTLSADPHRSLIGDDEHGWSDNSIFNFEGGCYAKTIRLSQEYEPQIWSALRFGSLLENVMIESGDRIPDYDDGSLTENTRAAYPLDYIDNYHPSGVGESPETIIFLTADAFGVLPPIAKLTREQAMYHFLSGYTSKLAGTERGIATPESTFSACFGQCFFPLSPTLYAEILGKKLQQNPHTNVYLVNTGWFGGGYGVGKRIAIDLTRAMVSAALKGELEKISYQADPLFKVLVPQSISGIPSEILNPRHSWQDLDDYDRQARELAKKFSENFQQFHQIRKDIVAAGPG
jgi:phosphoenolpyruvate carboxykinase (ATP)